MVGTINVSNAIDAINALGYDDTWMCTRIEQDPLECIVHELFILLDTFDIRLGVGGTIMINFMSYRLYCNGDFGFTLYKKGSNCHRVVDFVSLSQMLSTAHKMRNGHVLKDAYTDNIMINIIKCMVMVYHQTGIAYQGDVLFVLECIFDIKNGMKRFFAEASCDSHYVATLR